MVSTLNVPAKKNCSKMLYVLRFYTYLPKTINRIDLVNYFEEARYQKGILFAIYSFNEYQVCCNDTDFSKAYAT